MDDASGSSRLKRAGDRARHTLTVPQVAARLLESGVPRSERRIKYYCQNGTLDAGYLPSPTGDQWYVNPASVPGLIGDLKQFQEQLTRRQHAAADSDSPEKSRNSNTDAAGSSTLEHAGAGGAGASKSEGEGGVPQHAAAGSQQAPAAYLSQLEKRIEEKDKVITLLEGQLSVKDEQIKRHSERERETNLLIRGLQNLVLRLQPGRPANADVLDNDPLMQNATTSTSEASYPHP